GAMLSGIHGSGVRTAGWWYGETCNFTDTCTSRTGTHQGTAVEKGHVMAQQRDALTQLVQQHVGTNTGASKMTVVAFASKAIDPASGYRPSTGLIGKILQGASYRI